MLASKPGFGVNPGRVFCLSRMIYPGITILPPAVPWAPLQLICPSPGRTQRTGFSVGDTSSMSGTIVPSSLGGNTSCESGNSIPLGSQVVVLAGVMKLLVNESDEVVPVSA
uniref:(northern house mosquito) hypothetical protein n=1 Tax=Culex pipiens TaxID=7175 RepID=A0A8D8H4Y6_CULPI